MRAQSVKFRQALEEANVGSPEYHHHCQRTRCWEPTSSVCVVGGWSWRRSTPPCPVLSLPPCLGTGQARLEVMSLGTWGHVGTAGAGLAGKGERVGTCQAGTEGPKAERTAWGPPWGHGTAPGAPGAPGRCLLKQPEESKSSWETLP